jgi:hypothetical protein
MHTDRLAIAMSVGQGKDKSDGPLQTIGHCRSLELGGSQLCLEVEEYRLDLQDHELAGSLEDHVGGSAVRRDADWHLQADAPAGMSRAPDQLGHTELTGVPQPDSLGRIEPQGKVVAGSRRQPVHDSEPRQGRSSLRLAHQRLADSGDPGNLPLRHAGAGASRQQLASETRSQLIGAQ